MHPSKWPTGTKIAVLTALVALNVLVWGWTFLPHEFTGRGAGQPEIVYPADATTR